MTAKEEILRHYFERHAPRYVIETGLYQGHGSCYQFVGEVKVFAIDLDPQNVAAAVRASVIGLPGDSREVLPKLLTYLVGPALFWLDAHTNNQEGDEPGSALAAELAAILAWQHGPASTVLIDDVSRLGEPGWPTITEVREQAERVWHLRSEDDVLRLTPL